MNGSESSWDEKASQPPDSRTSLRSSSRTRTRTRHSDPDPAEPQDPGQSLHGKQRRRNLDSALAEDLSQISVDAVPTSKEKRSRSSSGAVPSCRSSGSTSRSGLSSVARLVKLGRCKNVVVVAGAGISTASGIPDFRTPGTGLYANLEKYNVPYPEAIFNIDFFSNDPQPFFLLAKALYPGAHRPNYIHYFIRMLHHKGLLRRVYTQNIDGLEKLCGVPDDKLVEAHGSFATASCHLCYTPYPSEEAKRAIMNDSIPTCSFCAATVKPDVVFFGEDLPQKYFLHTEDFPKADLLIIMGTSLQIEPFASLVNTVRSTVPRLLLNRHAVGPFERVPLRRGDHMELGDLAETVRRFAKLLGWSGEIEELMKRQELLSLPALVTSPSSQSTQTFRPDAAAASEPERGAGTPGSGPRDQRGAGSGGEDTDSETDSKSSTSSNASK
ncbi:NAD-dependent protein deacetylase sirtuin-3 isoform X2 [Kryptolebias marmoratus]|nr:NAD-dependent protein deacetylase sirtuin-3 isoform X2 [Kryptolebias marmoratus]XP_017278509.1 NAD-dependent protein deacetylase sirtuin-3 isoform X2 [Kryptolebias marmoratus]XP_037834033.1 NAD-dependent protein deacetylase sirtuin-3 isoform X2 [Kryptolebias marmoratus]XP_037834034.1 NAD-dependent protein deacetylase sirtuin-3 isoform X2 [Kryptolebias marmoratus]